MKNDVADVLICFFFFHSAVTRQGIVDTMERALSDPSAKSVVICGQNGMFCGGEDAFIISQGHIK